LTPKPVGKFQVVSAQVVVKCGRRGKMRFCTYITVARQDRAIVTMVQVIENDTIR